MEEHGTVYISVEPVDMEILYYIGLRLVKIDGGSLHGGITACLRQRGKHVYRNYLRVFSKVKRGGTRADVCSGAELCQPELFRTDRADCHVCCRSRLDAVCRFYFNRKGKRIKSNLEVLVFGNILLAYGLVGRYARLGCKNKKRE